MHVQSSTVSCFVILVHFTTLITKVCTQTVNIYLDGIQLKDYAVVEYIQGLIIHMVMKLFALFCSCDKRSIQLSATM